MQYKKFIKVFIFVSILIGFTISVFLVIPYWIDMIADKFCSFGEGLMPYFSVFCSMIIIATPIAFIGWQYFKAQRTSPLMLIFSTIAILSITLASIFVCLHHRSSFYHFQRGGEGKGHMSFLQVRKVLNNEQWMLNNRIIRMERYQLRIYHMTCISLTGLGVIFILLLQYVRNQKIPDR